MCGLMSIAVNSFRHKSMQADEQISEQLIVAMPAAVLGKLAAAPWRPMRAARGAEEISTPHTILVPVTFLVSATDEVLRLFGRT